MRTRQEMLDLEGRPKTFILILQIKKSIAKKEIDGYPKLKDAMVIFTDALMPKHVKKGTKKASAAGAAGKGGGRGPGKRHNVTVRNGKCLAKNNENKCGVALYDGDALSATYSNGKVIVFTDINFASHSSYYTADNREFLTSLISDVTTSTVSTITSVQAGITSSQQTEVNTATAKTSTTNNIYLTQSGSGLDLDIVQDGDNNLIIGSDLTTAGSIQGDNNEITLTQKNNNNVLGIDVNGNTNDVDIWQDTDQRAVVNITGASNTLDLEQLHLNNNGEHFSKVTVNGNSNNMTIDQKETGDKILFLEVDGSNNVQVDQKGTGNHFLDINLTDSHTVDVTQDGSGSHNATIHLSGNPSSVTLTQDSSTNQNYHLQQSCSSSSCSATVTQN